MVATLQQLQASLLQAAGGRGLLAVVGSRLAHSVADGSSTPRSSGTKEEGKRAHHGVPASLPELPPRRPPPPHHQQLSLASINDPEAWGLASGPLASSSETAGYFWLGSSLSNPKEPLGQPPSPQRGGSPSTLAPQGFRTAMSRQAAQRKIAFRSSMMEPELPFPFRSSMTDPPVRP